MQLNKIRIKSGRTTIDFQKENSSAGTPDEMQISTDDTPRDEFTNQFQDLAKWIARLCEVDHGDWEQTNPITVIEVDFKWKESGMGVVLKGKRKIQNADTEQAENTPIKIDGSEDDRKQMHPDMKADLQRIIQHAIEFVNGKRKQMQLFEQQEKELQPA